MDFGPMRRATVLISKLPLAAALTALMLSLPLGARAGVYKWVDNEGNTVYSQSPPPAGAPSAIIKAPPSVDTKRALRDLKKSVKRADKAREQRAEHKAELHRLAEEKVEQEKGCAEAQDRLLRVNTLPRVYTQNEQGDRRRLSEEERQARIADARADIAKYCSD